MNRICFCDLDNVVADSTARFAKAEEAKSEYLKTLEAHTGADTLRATGEKYANNLYWQTALDPSLVELDTLIPGAREALDDLRYLHGYYTIVFLTSRPESMRQATEQWLDDNGLSLRYTNTSERRFVLIMKAESFQFTKTPVWKAGMVQTLFLLYDASEMIVVDDSPEILFEISQWIASPQYVGFSSLKKAAEALEQA